MLIRWLIVFVLVLPFVPSAWAQTNHNDWGNVMRLSLGSTIIVKTKKGAKFAGELTQVTDDSLSLIVNVSRTVTQVIDLRRDEIREVQRRKSRTVGTIVGGAIGAGIGLALGGIADSRSRSKEDPGLATSLGGLLGGLFGAVVGTAVPLRGKKIYVAP